MAKTRKKKTLAEQADRHRLYQLSVQCAEAEIDFVEERFRTLKGRPARLLREDFCGPAEVCCEWVRRHKNNRAIGVDLDDEVLQWSRDNNIGRLSKSQRKRIELIEENVLEVETETVDVVSAMNFSYWLLMDRGTLKRYFKRVHKALADDGILFLDSYGGYESHQEIIEEREIEDGDFSFTYTWEQERFNPVTHELECSIHFAFPDGSSIESAFHYVWRLWTLPEIKDLLTECGFDVTFYWQGFDEDGEGDGEFEPVTSADSDAGWICYITAEKC
ncbi:SAM-dependent methyltransferase [Solemya velum gill symbiont]|uniref:class I SAM-dependent methyltransferase n=1 Tax=Solemya velum gill symbiont TaxID=2340 RepID=UPI000997CA13|nr:class I SAM-dependent methyltransferase [Solemya velum gill symbiont]OOZ16666.1 SAM-dependent methyltransferase [Solemya velum gill symbiont]OOZ25640.1 SAM-dependent methyltransferase [Solemya velum gill symbiont]